ncbi:amidinotransferase [Tsuneonella deserti]|uniref:arginine deiminase n=1 Tax=Tsuneonella deserti TaxID=2035528 RepID=A0ABQ1SE17_9SPHN|nr:arginine deiminase family protein [Tsuneonella deserti]GGE04244.1 amidinotransferase [Tsuneonella deserti]
MKLDFALAHRPFPETRLQPAFVRVRGETHRLTDVALCTPRYLAPVPCCSVTKEALREGYSTDNARAVAQHGRLRELLQASGVRCHSLPPAAGQADMCFTRDAAVATPWGLVALHPALDHRASEVDKIAGWATSALGERPRRIRQGRIEGGDVCIARPGLLIIGVSGARTDEAGAAEFAAPFEADGWDVLRYRFDEHFLHLDTIFCMLDEKHALACTDVLDDAFMAELAARGIALIPVTYKEARRLGCNVLSIDGHSIIAAAGTPRVARMMREHGFTVHELELDELTACGGGVHCLTMPLQREG